MNKTCLLIVVLGLFSSGCSTVEVSDYSQSCVTADDCIAESFGDVCSCGCDYQAISKSAFEQYQADRADAYDYCVGLYSCDACQPPGPVACNAGKCAMAQ